MDTKKGTGGYKSAHGCMIYDLCSIQYSVQKLRKKMDHSDAIIYQFKEEKSSEILLEIKHL